MAGGYGPGPVLALTRYNADGTLDATFGKNGIDLSNFKVSSIGWNAVGLESVNGNTDIVMVANNGGKFVVARFNPNGSPDTSFGSNGEVQTTVSSLGGDGAYSVAIQADGRVVATGDAKISLSPITNLGLFPLLRYNSDGSLDSTFGNGGVATGLANPSSGAVSGVTIQPADGKIVAVGTGYPTYPGSQNMTTIVRFNTNGSLDTTFNGTGIVFANPGSSIASFATGVAVQPSDGKIVTIGDATDFVLMRFNVNGSLDSGSAPSSPSRLVRTDT